MQFLQALILYTLLIPGITFAAGFAKESLFLSKSPVVEGEMVYIHAVIANDSATQFAGEVIFEDNETTIGSVGVSIAPGGAQTVSLSWKPSAGSHPLTAELTATDKTVVEKLSATFDIKPKPQPEETSGTSSTVQSSADVQEVIAGISPSFAEASGPVFGTIDSLRQTGTEWLDKGIAWAKEPQGEGEVAGQNTGVAGTVLGVIKTAFIYLMELLKFVLGNAGIFYPAIALLFLYFLWRTFKRMRRPRYE